MSLETVRAAIVAKLNAVPGIGRVHSYERFAATNAKFVELYATGDKILGWHARRVAAETKPVSFDVHEDATSWEIRGYASLADANESEIAMDTLVESIRAAFLADDTLGGALLMVTFSVRAAANSVRSSSTLTVTG